MFYFKRLLQVTPDLPEVQNLHKENYVSDNYNSYRRVAKFEIASKNRRRHHLIRLMDHIKRTNLVLNLNISRRSITSAANKTHNLAPTK